MYVGFISISDGPRAEKEHKLASVVTYHTKFYKDKKEVKRLFARIKKQLVYPKDKYVEHIILTFNQKDEKGFQTVCSMMSAYHELEEILA